MAATRPERALLLALVTTMAILFLQYSTPAGAAKASAGAMQSDNTEFIRRSCGSTLYPSLCYISLAGYADAVALDPTRLAHVAANVSLARVRSDSSHVSSLCRSAAAEQVDKRTTSALQDCEETLDNAADLTRQATTELGLLPSAKGTEVAWRVSNVQTWLSAALTNEATCMDGFAGAAGSAVKADVLRRVGLTEHYTSNALALVNRLVGTNR